LSKEQYLRQVSSIMVDPVVRASVRLHVSANALTLTGLAICLISAGIVGAGYLLAGGVVLLFSGLFDMFDGAVARATGTATKFGALVDSVSDRVSEAALLGALVVMYTFRGFDPGVFLATAALVGSLLTSYVRARAEGLGVECRVGVLTRAERVIILGLGLMLDRTLWQYGAFVAVAIITAFSYVTVVQRIAHVRQQTRS
jgi:CDP-diacylglycerol--glycerol-3-phosphate 3-phosphatidyltransferase